MHCKSGYFDSSFGGVTYLSSRKAAKTAHPDVGGSEEKMATLNEAYEVLNDPGKST